jgi:predicted nucleic acid-binding protein
MQLAASAISATPPVVVIDASVWVAFFLRMDVSHAASYQWIDQHTAKGGIIVAPAILLTEVAAAISRRLGQPQTAINAANTIEQLSSTQVLPMDSILMQEATNIAATLRLRGADAIYVAVAKQLNIPLLTWDTEQLTRPVGVITTMTP